MDPKQCFLAMLAYEDILCHVRPGQVFFASSGYGHLKAQWETLGGGYYEMAAWSPQITTHVSQCCVTIMPNMFGAICSGNLSSLLNSFGECRPCNGAVSTIKIPKRSMQCHTHYSNTNREYL